MNKITIQGKECSFKMPLGVYKKNYKFFQKLENPLADTDIKKSIAKINSNYKSEVLKISKLDLSQDVKDDLIAMERELLESEKQILISITIDEQVDLLKTAIEGDVNWDEVDIIELGQLVNDIIKKNT